MLHSLWQASSVRTITASRTRLIMIFKQDKVSRETTWSVPASHSNAAVSMTRTTWANSSITWHALRFKRRRKLAKTGLEGCRHAARYSHIRPANNTGGWRKGGSDATFWSTSRPGREVDCQRAGQDEAGQVTASLFLLTLPGLLAALGVLFQPLIGAPQIRTLDETVCCILLPQPVLDAWLLSPVWHSPALLIGPQNSRPYSTKLSFYQASLFSFLLGLRKQAVYMLCLQANLVLNFDFYALLLVVISK